MANPLLAALILLVAVSASAQTAAQLKAEWARVFIEGGDLSRFSATGRDAELIELLEQAKYVQAGREPGDEKETHIAFVRSVARRLDAPRDAAVTRYGERVRAARTAVASPRELQARAALAEDVLQNPGISEEKKRRVSRDLAVTSAYLNLGLKGNAEFIGAPSAAPAELRPIIAAAPVYGSNGQRDWRNIPPQVQPLQLVTHPTPSPQGPAPSASAGMMSWSTLASYFDWEKGKQVAIEAYTGTMNYAKSMGAKCYRFFKQALIDAGVLSVPNPQSTGLIGLRPGAANMFSQDVKKNPAILDRMGYRQVDLAQASDDPSSVPDGSLLIYAAGCSFADATSGHAEITVGPDTYTSLRAQNARLRQLPVGPKDVRVCHFTCTTRSMPFLRTYGKRGCLKMYVPVKAS